MTLLKHSWLLPVLLGALGSAAHAQTYLPTPHDARMKVHPKTPLQAYAFELQQVKLLDSPFKVAEQADTKYLLKIEPDRLLADFREHSGLQAKGKRYGGWESTGLAGHTLGHYLSACALAYASTGNIEFKRRVDYMVAQLDECQKARKTGYVGAIPKEDQLWAEVASGNIRSRGFDLNGAWSPWYTVHKIMAGLLDAYLYGDNETALIINQGIADWTGNTIKGLDEAKMQEMMVCEYGGMAETLANTYALSGQKKYLDLSYRFYDKRILDPLAARTDILPGKHSNTQIPKAIASARRYELTGDKKDAAIAEFFWQTVTDNHSYATGGNSNYEYLGEPGKLNDKLSENTTETCNTYNMLKLTQHLFAQHPSAKFMDYYERGLYNHILASQHHETGMTTYFVPLRMGGRKTYSDEFNTFTCCVGSGMENHVKYAENIYFQGQDGSVYVNLFMPSELNWQEKGVTLRQDSQLPANTHVTFTVAAVKPSSFKLRLRRPQWTKNPQVRVNGKAVAVAPDAEGYLVLDRKWKNNDRVELTLPADFYTEALPDNPDRRAVFYGPTLLAGVLGTTEPEPVTGVPVLVTTNNSANDWVKPVDAKQLRFQTAGLGVPHDVPLIPFNQTGNEYYTVYWDVFTPEKWATQQRVYEAARKKQQELEAQTVDILRVGEMQPERDHSFIISEKAETGEEHGRKWRMVNEGGMMAFTLKVAPAKANTLLLTYWGMDNRGRVFDVLVDGEKIATEDLNKYKESRFYDISYSIPPALTKDKQHVKVTFQAKPNNSAGPVYGIRNVQQ
ncbi:glycoside hydrolase family 127 protein (plasmid) [Hymenobacter tibetensis]|uniref:Glycoside hydrolase family 127 protein n=1 Tax=Hymenobacter tibetensis TaxID=497967 RepID=A0ABY4D4P1_9BACT|nr:glycoside hydrolase family 127 protein [Hymenobacter tibetensis]UOG77494.1 glycoside hydrolase family 127 protein [Hymenobacter tibetensis]